MKKIIVLFIAFCLLATSVSALVPYTGAPSLPYLIYGHVSWNDQLLAGARIEISNQATGYTKQITTDSNGYWQEETGNWLTTLASRHPVLGYIEGIYDGDTIKIKILDGCGTGDTCEKTFIAYSVGYEEWAEIDFDINGELSCPPINCPSCSCGGGSSGGSCPSYDLTDACDEIEELCPTEFNNLCDLTTDPCPEPTTCPEEKVCPEPEEPICPVMPSDNNLAAILSGIFGALIGGSGIYFYKKREAVVKNVGIKTYVSTDGKVKILHRHPGIRGYHDPDTSHRVVHERHEKGEITPLYKKGDDGVSRYVE